MKKIIMVIALTIGLAAPAFAGDIEGVCVMGEDSNGNPIGPCDDTGDGITGGDYGRGGSPPGPVGGMVALGVAGGVTGALYGAGFGGPAGAVLGGMMGAAAGVGLGALRALGMIDGLRSGHDVSTQATALNNSGNGAALSGAAEEPMAAASASQPNRGQTAELPSKDALGSNTDVGCSRLYDTNCVDPKQAGLAPNEPEPTLLPPNKTALDQLWGWVAKHEGVGSCYDGREACPGNAPTSGVNIRPRNAPAPFALLPPEKFKTLKPFSYTKQGQEVFNKTNFMSLWKQELEAGRKVRDLKKQLETKTGVDRRNFKQQLTDARDEQFRIRQQRMKAEEEIINSQEFRSWNIDIKERPGDEKPRDPSNTPMGSASGPRGDDQ